MMGDEINIEKIKVCDDNYKALKARCSLLSLDVSTLRVKIDKLRIALQTLYDEQNGPPLENDKKDWQEAMRMAEEALMKEE
jgi:hypothetical protein